MTKQKEIIDLSEIKDRLNIIEFHLGKVLGELKYLNDKGIPVDMDKIIKIAEKVKK